MLRNSWLRIRHCILDGHFSHTFVVKIVMMFDDNTKNNDKRGQG